ncbi:MAG TPA: FHA domain-containing protein [Anaerolineae bacterium]|nr:FHA domain-containing protein [Anaerolineae bacterium]
MSDNPVLIAREGQLIGQRWTIDKDNFLIGRGSDCDIVLPERQVSRHHIQINKQDNRYVLHDFGSKNGTHLNGSQVQEDTVLQDGDEIQIALCVKLVFVGTDATLPLTFEPPQEQQALLLNEEQRTVTIHDQTLSPPLSLAQFRLLKTLYDAEGAVCDRDTIVRAVWPGTEGMGVSEQAIDALVRRLRDRLAEIDEHNYIVTVRGHGFRLDNEPT